MDAGDLTGYGGGALGVLAATAVAVVNRMSRRVNGGALLQKVKSLQEGLKGERDRRRAEDLRLKEALDEEVRHRREVDGDLFKKVEAIGADVSYMRGKVDEFLRSAGR